MKSHVDINGDHEEIDFLDTDDELVERLLFYRRSLSPPYQHAYERARQTCSTRAEARAVLEPLDDPSPDFLKSLDGWKHQHWLARLKKERSWRYRIGRRIDDGLNQTGKSVDRLMGAFDPALKVIDKLLDHLEQSIRSR